MDTELARTFLAVITAGNFVSAAERLHVTQSTVSTRIKRLEEILRVELFVRNKSGTTLTPAGREFQRHAAILTRTVELAKQETGAAGGYSSTLTIGSRLGLWEDLLARWLPIFRGLAPSVAVRAFVGIEEQLMSALIEGRANIGVMYTPQARPGLRIEPIFEERLVMASTQKNPAAEPGRDYVYVDWGPEFFAQHSLAFPNFSGAPLTVDVGWLGLVHILGAGGCGYFPARLLHAHELAGRIFRVPKTPEFHLTAHLCYAVKPHSEALNLALETIRRVAIETE